MDLDSLEISSTDTGIYNINLYGDAYNTDKTDETNTIRFNDLVNNVYDFSIDSVQMALGKNAVINISNSLICLPSGVLPTHRRLWPPWTANTRGSSVGRPMLPVPSTVLSCRRSEENSIYSLINSPIVNNSSGVS